MPESASTVCRSGLIERCRHLTSRLPHLTPDDVEDFWSEVSALASEDEVAQILRGVALGVLSDWTRMVFASENVREADVSTFERWVMAFRVTSGPDLDSLRNLLRRRWTLNAIEAGRLTSVASPGLDLPDDEMCYLNWPATLVEMGQSGWRYEVGGLRVTNSQVCFLGAKVWEVAQRHVTGAWKGQNGLLALAHESPCQEPVMFQVGDPEFAAAVITGVSRQHRSPTERAAVVDLPLESRRAIWSRDEGRCTRCGATDYVEFTRTRPAGRGEAILLLCRACAAKE